MAVILVYLIVGLCAGLLSGLLGLGGGVIIVPILIVVFTSLGFAPEVLTHLAIGTSLATIMITSISSVYTHHHQGTVRWELLYWLAPGVAIGAGVGAMLATMTSGVLLQLMFGCFLALMATQMMMAKTSVTGGKAAKKGELLVVGTGVGAISATFGIGGGSLTVPYLSHRGVEMRKAVGSSAVCGLPIALFGAFTYIVFGMDHPKLPDSSVGFVYWPAWMGIIIMSAPAARTGAKLAKRLNEVALKRIFAAVLFVLGVRFIWMNSKEYLVGL